MSTRSPARTVTGTPSSFVRTPGCCRKRSARRSSASSASAGISTPDYAWGHFLYKGASEILQESKGTNLGNAVLPLGATDFTSALIKVQQAKPDVFVVFQSGD